MQGLLKYFLDIDDPKSERNQKHPLITLIGTPLLTSLAGIDRFSGFADYAEAHYEKLIAYFDFPYGCPSHETYQRHQDVVDYFADPKLVSNCDSSEDNDKDMAGLNNGLITHLKQLIGF